MESILQLDKEFFLFLNSLGNTTWDGFWVFVTHKWNSIPIYFLLLFFSYRQFGIKNTIYVLIAVALMILCVDQLANFFKYGFQRLRPCFDTDVNVLMRQVQDSCEHRGLYGYYSAHAANSYAIAIFFSLILKKNRLPMAIFILLWASLVAYSRIYIGVHFPFDVITGMFFGTLFGWIFAKLLLSVQAKLAR
ncbi:phosphatase PAP2 family protein [Aurantibacter crassamenti]|uniref:phosphatase PAP2 family protein n=1 Tax=Aurantibacter crassamenti TaxID=1837375 RepID=UPI001939DC10|nr:phosphatase PAP2 family protein [Aurantibacter crassamenti]MBM1106454.1 phosphatase PAP2 family protein [Aurantibacter crassamenti]